MLIGLHGVIMVALNLLSVALAVACSVRGKTAFQRYFWPLLTALAMLSGVLAAVVGGYFLFRQNFAPRWFFGFFLAVFLVSAAGIVGVLRRGLAFPADPWPRRALAAWLALAAALNIIVMAQMQSQSLLDLARVQVEATSELMARVPGSVPPTMNARIAYEAAIAALARNGDALPDVFAGRIDPATDPLSPAVRRFLADNSETLAALKRATALPAFSARRESASFLEWPMPDLGGYLRLSALLNLAARTTALAGDVPAALETLAQVRRLAGHVAQGPFLISHFLADRIDSMRIRSLEFIMAKVEITAAQLKPALELTAPSGLDRLGQALCREAQGQLQAFTMAAATSDIHAVSGGTPAPLAAPSAVTRMWRAYFLPDDLRATRDIVTRQLCLPAASFDELGRHLAVIEQARQAGKMGILSTIVASDYTDILGRAMRRDALEKLAALALAATAFKEARGHWPDTVTALAPDFIATVPVDPFDGQLFKLTLVEGGLTLFSAGSESVDTKDDPIRFCLGRAAYDRCRVHATP